jgi:uncharacterized membrane protein
MSDNDRRSKDSANAPREDSGNSRPAEPIPESASGVLSARAAERAAGALLRWGTIASILLVVCGLLRFFTQHPDWLSDPEKLQLLRSPDHPFPRSIAAIVEGAATLDGMAIIMIGVLALITTPILRVIVSGLAFARSGDRAFAAFAVIVLVLLAVAFAAG